MFIEFFQHLRRQGMSVSLREYLDLLLALQQGTIGPSLEEFYYLSRSLLIKQEGQLDAYDLIFGRYFRGKIGMEAEAFWEEVPEDWLRSELSKLVDPEDLRTLEEIGGLEALMARFKELLREQDEGHAGGDTYIGVGGSSPYGQGGLFEGGMRIGKDEKQLGQASKVWDRRQYRNLRDDLDLDTRDVKLVLRRLRELTREGRPTELDLDATIRRTSENAGMLDLRLRPSRKNRVKVLLLLDVGGSMDEHIHRCEQLFSAARYEFKHLEHYYFHNCLYEHVWRDNRRRFGQRLPTWELLHSYPPDYKVILVGDASMSPLELTHAGGSVEHWNEEPGLLWLQRLREQFPRLVWLNPTPEAHWEFSHSTQLLRSFTRERMYPLTLAGLGQAMRSLRQRA